MSDFLRVCKTSEIPNPGKRMFPVEERLVVIVQTDGQFYCLDDVCTHDGGPLGDGQLFGHELACPRHGARFDVRTGEALTMPATESTVAHEVQVRGDEVWVKLLG